MDGKNLIQNILSFFEQCELNFDIYIVANLQTRTTTMPPIRIIHTDESEFFSRSEFAEIASAIFYSFGFAKVFYSEIEFIEYILEKNINYDECIVFNYARDGRSNGKKSLIPAFCDLLNIKYTGSDAFVISLLRNKYIYTEFLYTSGMYVPKSRIFSCANEFGSLEKDFLNHHIIVKNRYESASIGLYSQNVFFFDHNAYDKLSTIMKNMRTDSILVQEYIDGIECEILVLQYNGIYYALDPVQILFKTEHNFLDSDTSNQYNYEFNILKSPLNPVIQETAIKAAELLGIKDYARFDFRIKNNIPYLFDIAGTPYTIYHSSIAYLFVEYYNLPYESIYKVIVACMLSNYQLRQK